MWGNGLGCSSHGHGRELFMDHVLGHWHHAVDA